MAADGMAPGVSARNTDSSTRANCQVSHRYNNHSPRTIKQHNFIYYNWITQYLRPSTFRLFLLLTSCDPVLRIGKQ